MKNKELLTAEKIKQDIEHALNITDKGVRMDAALRALYFLVDDVSKVKKTPINLG